ncbi:MAG: hypothetical protein KDE27_20285 [Planctomycetes bacterium]|nr:hypothetical protein [Planctomycetota bacterium]
MNTLPLCLSLLATVAVALPAQTQTLRGGVEDVQGTQNQFFLDCTNLPMFSNTINLNQWTNTEAIMQVVNVGTAQNPMLRVDQIAAANKIMDMGNLRFGQSNTWEVNAPAGSFCMVFIDFLWNTGYTPYGSVGTYLLGPTPVSFRSGFASGQNQFRFNFTMPTLPQHLGVTVSSQALVIDPSGTAEFSNADCKDVQN